MPRDADKDREMALRATSDLTVRKCQCGLPDCRLYLVLHGGFNLATDNRLSLNDATLFAEARPALLEWIERATKAEASVHSLPARKVSSGAGVDLFTKALTIAAKAHAGQVDKAGAPYILHPLRMMLQISSQEGQIVAILHDVVEDSDYTLDNLREEGFPEDIILAVGHLTRRPDEPYNQYIERVSRNPLARLVKMVDLGDNADLSRIKNPTEKDYERITKYNRAFNYLIEGRDNFEI